MRLPAGSAAEGPTVDRGLRTAIALAKEAAARQLAGERSELAGEERHRGNGLAEGSEGGRRFSSPSSSRSSSLTSGSYYDSEGHALSHYSSPTSSYNYHDDQYSSDASLESSSCTSRSSSRSYGGRLGERAFYRPEADEPNAAGDAPWQEIPARVDVVIVGAGPTGLALAIDCQRKGLSYICVDVRQEMASDSRAVLLHPRTLEIMQDLGVADALILRGIRLRGLRMFVNGALVSETPLGPLVVPPHPQPSGLPLSSLSSAFLCASAAAAPPASSSSSATPFPYAVVLDQSATEAVLHERLRQLGGFVHRPVAVWRMEHQDVAEPACFAVPPRRRRHRRQRSPARRGASSRSSRQREGRSSEMSYRSGEDASSVREKASPNHTASEAASPVFSAEDGLEDEREKREVPSVGSGDKEGKAPAAGRAQEDAEDDEGRRAGARKSGAEIAGSEREGDGAEKNGEKVMNGVGEEARSPGKDQRVPEEAIARAGWSRQGSAAAPSKLPQERLSHRCFTTVGNPKRDTGRGGDDDASSIAPGFFLHEERDSEEDEDVDGYPVTIHMAKLSDSFGINDPAFISVKCRYVVGCDGAKSMIRKASSVTFDGTSRTTEFVLADVSLDWCNMTGSSGVGHQEVSSLSDPALVVPDGSSAEKAEIVATLHRILDNSPLDRLNLFLSEAGSLFLIPLLPPYYRVLPCTSCSAADDFATSAHSSPLARAASVDGDDAGSDRGRGFAPAEARGSRGRRDSLEREADRDAEGRTSARDGGQREGGLGRASALLAHTEASGNLRWRIMAVRDVPTARGPSSPRGRGDSAAPANRSDREGEADGGASARENGTGAAASDRGKGSTSFVSEDELIRLIEKMLPGTIVRRVHSSSAYAAGSRVASRFKECRCFLAGDAAHVHPPFFSEGLNLGVQDAFNLGWKLASVLKGGASTRLLESYHQERHEVAKEVMQRASRTLGFLLGTGGKPSFLSRCVLQVVGPLLSRLPVLSEAVARSLSVVDVTYRAPSDVLGVEGAASYASLTPGMEVPDCLVKVTEIYRARTPLPPPAPPTYLYELLGKSQHVLLLHLLLLPAGSRVRNVFGCEMPGGPLAARYNSSCFSALARLARLAALASSERRGRGGGGEVERALPETDWLQTATASSRQGPSRARRGRKTWGGLRIVWCIHGSLAAPHTVATPTSITTAMPRSHALLLHPPGRSGSTVGVPWAAVPSRTFSFLRGLSSANVFGTEPRGAAGDAPADVEGRGSGLEGPLTSILSSTKVDLFFPSLLKGGGARGLEAADAERQPSDGSAASGEGGAAPRGPGGPAETRDGRGPGNLGESRKAAGGSLGSLSSWIYGTRVAEGSPHADGANGSYSSWNNSRFYAHQSTGGGSDDDDGGNEPSTILLRRHLLELLPSGLLSQLQGPALPHPSLLLVDFVDEVITKFGLRLAPPGTAHAAARSGAFTLIRPDGHVAQGGYAGDAVASRALLDYFMNYF